MREPIAVVGDFFERLWNARELELAETLIHPDCETHQLQSGADAAPYRRGPEAIRHHVGEWLGAFPDVRISVNQQVAQADRVATHCTMAGNHQGPWMGIPPTGRRVHVEMMVIHRVADGKIIEDWVLIESYGLFHQLGLLPAKADLIAGAVTGET